MSIYTKKGDDGTTGLLHGGRVRKDAERPTAYGEVDEAQAFLGVVRAEAGPELAEECARQEIKFGLYYSQTQDWHHPGGAMAQHPDELLEVDSVVGAFMMVRREAIAQAGLLDETYFMYGEDLDWAYQIKANNWKIFYNPAVTVTHVKRASSKSSPKAQIEFYRAMDIFYRKFYADTTPFWLHGLIVFGIRSKQQLTRFKHTVQGVNKNKQSAKV